MAPKQIARLLEIMATLRSPGGCPWDARQTPQTLKPYLLEETYEVLEALDEESSEDICEELGDLLLQVVFLARIFEERGTFSFDDVAGAIADKLVRRHPHVFADLEEDDADALHKNWDRIKAGEKSNRPQSTPLISAPPKTLPALQRAQKLLTKMDRYRLAPAIADKPASTNGAAAQALDTLSQAPSAEAERQFGQRLLATVELARQNGIDAENALRLCTDRLAQKTTLLEETLRQAGHSLADVPEEELRELWESLREDEDR